MLNVRDFGAKGDSIVDDTIAIQTAINSGNEIYIPYGTYLISSNLQLKSDLKISGNGILKANADGFQVITSGTAGLKNIIITGITIDGGGQVGGVVTTGKKGVTGIYLTNAINVIVDKVHVKNCGIMNSSNPFDDNGYSGAGILAECRSGKIKTIKIVNCIIENIAGGGIAGGDGIIIGGYSDDTTINPEDILISNCSVNIVGRNAISVAGDSGQSLANNVRVINNYLSNTQLAGIDVEDGSDIILSENQFFKCGNISYYYNYGSQYPATYRLRAAIATGEFSNDITISDSIIRESNMGITYGVLINKINNVFISDSDTTDITQGLANAGDLIITDSQFTSLKDCFKYYSLSLNNVKISNCIFSGALQILELHNGTFTSCTFKSGVIFTIPTSENITWNMCNFLGSGSGVGIDVSVNAYLSIKNCIVTNCRFDNLSIGVVANYENIIKWQIINCIFTNITDYGIRHLDSNGQISFKRISGNKFINSSSAVGEAISIIQANPAINIFQNYFEFFTTCISITNINYIADLLDAIVSENLAISCTNGIIISISTGNWDRCIVSYNNMYGCSGTKISLSGGNPNGFIINNIT